MIGKRAQRDRLAKGVRDEVEMKRLIDRGIRGDFYSSGVRPVFGRRVRNVEREAGTVLDEDGLGADSELVFSLPECEIEIEALSRVVRDCEDMS